MTEDQIITTLHDKICDIAAIPYEHEAIKAWNRRV